MLKFNNKTFFKSGIKFSQAKFFGAAKKNILVIVITLRRKGSWDETRLDLNKQLVRAPERRIFLN